MTCLYGFVEYFVAGMMPCDVGTTGAELVAKCLKENLTCRAIDLRDNVIGDGGARAMAEMLERDDNTVTYLYLYNNDISDTGAVAFSEALKANKSLTYLSLSNNRVADEGATALAEALRSNVHLVYMGLAKNDIGNAGAAAIGQMLGVNKTLTELVLSYNKFLDEGDKAIAEGLKNNSTLEYLTLHQDKVGEEGARAIVDALKVNTTILYLGMGMSNTKRNISAKIAKLLRRNIEEKERIKADQKTEFEEVVNGNVKGPWNRSKIMVIGQGRSGKTATIRSLLGQPFDDNLDSTIGARLTQIQTTTRASGEWSKFESGRGTDYTTHFAARLTVSRLSQRNSNRSAHTRGKVGLPIFRKSKGRSESVDDSQQTETRTPVNSVRSVKHGSRERGISSLSVISGESRLSVPRAMVNYMAGNRGSVQRNSRGRVSLQR